MDLGNSSFYLLEKNYGILTLNRVSVQVVVSGVDSRARGLRAHFRRLT